MCDVGSLYHRDHSLYIERAFSSAGIRQNQTGFYLL